MLIDTHCHLDAAEFDADRDAVYAAAIEAGVERIVVPGVTVNRKFRPKSKIADYPACLEAYGIHPLYVDQSSPEDICRLRGWLQQAPPVAIGEIGLDFYVDGLDTERQTHFFVEQLKLAREFDLPVLLHVRRAVDPVLKQLRRIRVRGGIAHAFNGSRQQAGEFIKLGFGLGFGGTLTFSGSTRIRELAKTLPLESIVLETDAPDIPPAWLNGGRNSPSELPRIADVLAELRGLSSPEVIAATAANARRLLPGL
jgi:TatD DNase family protein